MSITENELSDDQVERMLAELSRLARSYRTSRTEFENTLLAAYDAGIGATAIARAVGHLSEGGVRMLVKRRKTQAA